MNIQEEVQLHLLQLCRGMPSLTPAMGEIHAEAAAVCLDDQKHVQGVSLKMEESEKQDFRLFWRPSSVQARLTHADEEVATELGACGIAFLLAQKCLQINDVQRMKKGDGFDYWIGNRQTVDLPLENKRRLEVSGIRNGVSKINGRVKKKKTQTTKSDESNFQAVVVVVEFGSPAARMVLR